MNIKLREALFGFSGRNRKPQIALVKTFGFDEYAQPAGGCCFLTDSSYAQKLQDLWTHRGQRDYELEARHLLCPLPVIRTQSRVQALAPGDELTVFFADPGALEDIPAWCRIRGHTVLSFYQAALEIQMALLHK